MSVTELKALSEAAQVPADYREKCKAVVDKIFGILKKSSYPPSRCRLQGGLGKNTSTRAKADADVCAFYNKFATAVDKTKILAEYKAALQQSSSFVAAKTKSLALTMDGVPVDLMVAFDFSQPGHPRPEESQWDRTMEKVGQSTSAAKVYSCELSERSASFVAKRSDFVRQVVGLAKLWNQSVMYNRYVYGRSHLFELIALKAGEEVEAGGGDLKKGLVAFLNKVANLSKINIVFEDFYEAKYVFAPGGLPRVVDPVNPGNNILAMEDQSMFLKCFEKAAASTLNKINSGTLVEIFYPQLPVEISVHGFNLKARNVLCDFFQKTATVPLMPDKKMAAKFSTDKALTHTMDRLLWAVAVLVTTSSVAKTAAVLDNVKDFVSKTVASGCPVNSDTSKHDGKEVIMSIPVGNMDKILYLSFDIIA